MKQMSALIIFAVYLLFQTGCGRTSELWDNPAHRVLVHAVTEDEETGSILIHGSKKTYVTDAQPGWSHIADAQVADIKLSNESFIKRDETIYYSFDFAVGAPETKGRLVGQAVPRAAGGEEKANSERFKGQHAKSIIIQAKDSALVTTGKVVLTPLAVACDTACVTSIVVTSPIWIPFIICLLSG